MLGILDESWFKSFISLKNVKNIFLDYKCSQYSQPYWHTNFNFSVLIHSEMIPWTAVSLSPGIFLNFWFFLVYPSIPECSSLLIVSSFANLVSLFPYHCSYIAHSYFLRFSLVLALDLHSRILRVHLLSSYLVLWPAHHHFICVIPSLMLHVLISPTLLFWDPPLLLVVSLGFHCRILRVHLFSSYLALWPAHRHFDMLYSVHLWCIYGLRC